MYKVKKILFIVRSFSKGGPQPIRFQNIINFLKDDYDIHIIEFIHDKEKIISEDGISIHQLQYSKIGRIINPLKTNTSIRVDKMLKKSVTANFVFYIKSFIRGLFFPDTLCFEINKLRKKIFSLEKQFDFEIVVASAFPFSTLAVSKKIKQSYPSIKFLYDIGDPFYGNAKNGFIRNYFAKKYENYYLRFIDKLIVTNELTKKHYSETYGKSLTENNIAVIEQGIKSDFIKNIETAFSLKEKKEITLTYAGQLYIKLREPFALYEAIKKSNLTKKQSTLYLLMLGSYNKYFIKIQIAPIHIKYLGAVNQMEVFDIYLKSDIIVFIDNAFGMQTPGKIFELIAVGKPILFISNNLGSPASQIAKQFNHIFYSENNPNSIITCIEKIIDQDNYNIDNSLLKHFSWEYRAIQYKESLESL